MSPTEAATGDSSATVEAAERLLRQGEPLLAYNLVQEGLAGAPGHLRLRQLKGLALARSGDLEQANRLLRAIAAEGMLDAETLGMLARTHKDLGLAATDARRERHLGAAFRLYRDAYEGSRRLGAHADAYYTGINAAALAVYRDDRDTARRIAAEVQEVCARAREASGAGDYWLEATLGEAALILGDEAAAAAHYSTAAQLAAGRFGSLSSTRRQAELLAARLPGDHDWLATVLGIPPVLMFTGHMIDLPWRPEPRFPPEIEAEVGEAVRRRMRELRPLAAYGSAACGADILCLEAMRELGGETHIVLPFPVAEFRRASVDVAAGNWGERFERAIADADSVTITSDHRARDSTATFEYANLVFTGMAQLRAQVLDTRLCSLAIWDSESGGAGGGASSVVQVWRSRGLDVGDIHLPDLRPEEPTPPGSLPPPMPPPRPGATARAPVGFRHEIRAMLFADMVGFSQLSEDQIPSFVSQFLGSVADLNECTVHRPEHVETSGDGLYMVFADVATAAHYAMELSGLVNAIDWIAHGLPGNTQLRIALHCGPVYCGRNPVTDSPLYTGPHTSRTARIEPITPPGQVYASSAFAAVAAAVGVTGLSMNYVGRMPLPKGYGSLPLYHVRPLEESTSDSSSPPGEAATPA